jgi:acyl-CoA oxidase
MQSRKKLDVFTKNIEKQLNVCLRNNTIPSNKLIDAIAVSKVACIETSIEYVHRLRQEVGSYCLMDGTGFESADILQMCKFAEGDSRILMQKMVRDLLISFMKGNLENDNSD